jgi:GNAT superfamily N-acetyltransferase
MVALEGMSRTDAESAFVFAVKKAALGPYIEQKWGWNEEQQRQMHAERWNMRSYFRIVSNGKAVGTVAIHETADHLRLDEFYLEPAHQRQGIGSQVLASLLSKAGRNSLPVRLQCLKWNPVISLYRRHGFVVTHENETHYFMEHPKQ